jgi:hypothetical protein
VTLVVEFLQCDWDSRLHIFNIHTAIFACGLQECKRKDYCLGGFGGWVVLEFGLRLPGA